jgi:hypothetical protein
MALIAKEDLDLCREESLPKNICVWTLVLTLIAASFPLSSQVEAQQSFILKQVRLPFQVDESDPLHPTFAPRQYGSRLPSDFIKRATSPETRSALARLSAEERKKYADRLSQIVRAEIEKQKSSPKTLKPVGLRGILERQIGSVVPDVMPLSAMNSRGERFLLSANYQQGKIPAGTPGQPKISRLSQPPKQDGVQEAAARDQIAKSFLKNKFVSGAPFRQSFISRNRAGTDHKSINIQEGDNDFDGLPDSFENQVADAFTPYYAVSLGEWDQFCTFGDFVPQSVAVLYGGYPLSYFRVTPQGFITLQGQQYSALRADYLTLWNHDSGLVGGGGACALDLLGITDIIGELSSHTIDNERSAALLLAPVAVPDTYNLDPSAYASYSYYLAGHEDTFFDQSYLLYPGPPLPAGNHLLLFLSLSKHATYTFNPNYLPLIPAYVLVSTIAFLDFLYFTGQISEIEWLIYTGLAYDTYYGCVVERFSTPQFAYIADPRINVGEVSNPINSSRFIQDNSHGLRSKLENGIPW